MWRTLLILLICLRCGGAFGQQWVNGYGGTGGDGGSAVTVDGSGNIYLAGYFSGTANFGTTNLVANGVGTGLVVAKYNNGGIAQWTEGFSGTIGGITPSGIGLDSSGNIFVCGSFSGTANFGGTNCVSAGQSDCFLAKYSSQGAHIWSESFGSTAADSFNGLAVDSQGNVAVTGSFQGTVNFGGTNLSSAFGTQQNAMLCKYATSGSLVWAQSFFSSASDFGNGIAVDKTNNIVITGQFINRINLGNGLVFSANPNTPNIFVSKYNTGGTYIWAKTSVGTNADNSTAITLDGNGDATIGGTFFKSTDFGGGVITGTGSSSDLILAKYSGANGAFTWALHVGGDRGGSVGSVTSDSQNTIYFTGKYIGTMNFGVTSLTCVSNSNDIFISKVNPSGSVISAQSFGGPGTDVGNAMVVDGLLRQIVTGQFEQTANFGIKSLTSSGLSDAFLMQFPGVVTVTTNWYVDSSKTGTSDNSGTSPQNAFTNWVPLGGTDGQWTGKAKGGDTIWVFPGVGYVGNRTGLPDAINMYNINGSPNSPITFKAIQSSGLVVTPPLIVSGSFFTFDGRLSDTYTNLVNFDNMANLYQITNNINWLVKGVYGFGSNQQSGIYMPNSNYRCKFQWLHVDPKTFNTNNYPFGNNPNGVGANTHGVSIVQNTGEHLDGGEVAYCYIEEADQCCVSILNNNAPIWGGFRIHHNVLTKQGDAGARLAGGFEFDHNIVGTPLTIHGHPNGVVMAPNLSLFHHNVMLNSLDTMFYTPGGGTPTELGIKVYNNLFYTTWDWSFIYTNQYSSNLPFVNHSVGGMQFLVEANANNVEPWLPTTYTNFLLFNNTVMAGMGSVATNANAGISGIISLPNRYAPGNSLSVEPGLDRGFVTVSNFVNLNNLFYNVSASGSGQTIGGWQGWVDRFSKDQTTWTNPAITSTAGILFAPENVNGVNWGSSNVVVDYNNITADQAASKSFVYNGPNSTNDTFATAEAFNATYTTNGYTHNTSAHPTLVNTNAYDFHPRVSDTVLIAKGTDISKWTNSPGGLPQYNMDLSGVTHGSTPSIGAFEPQTDLILHYTFDDLTAPGSPTFAVSPFVTDITGYGSTMAYYGFISTPTNWPSQVVYTNNRGGFNFACQFVSNTNQIPAYGNFPIAQFGAVTNIGAFSNLTAITITVWMKYFSSQGDSRDNSSTIIDTIDGSPGNGSTWSLGRNSAYQTSFDIFTNHTYNTSSGLHINFPDNESTDWHFYAASFNCTNQVMSGYLDGTNFATVSFAGYSDYLTNLIVGVPQSSGSYAGKNGWIAIGCRTHNGSPDLSDSDLLPNNAWMDGQVADLRVYNRALGAGEVLALYNTTGTPAVLPPTPGPQDPVITANPLSTTVTAPATATFTSTASSTNSPITYQWFKNGSLIAGATTTTFTTPATTTADNGSTWFMQATAGGRTVQSTSAVLTVGAPGPQDPIITLNPVGQSVTAPATATFTSTASSTQALTFQWSKNGTPIAGATQTTYTTPPTVVGDNGSTFFMVATAGGRTAQSSTVTLLVSAPGPQDPLITSSPISQSVTAPATATFTSSATSTQSLTFQWSKNGTLIPGATATTYTTPPTSTSDNGSTWFMVATAGGRTDQSATATLTVFPQGPQDPIITLNPLSQFVIAPALVTFTSSATSTQALAFQWSKNGVSIPGATSTSYTTATAVSDNGSTWFMTATAGGRTIQSTTATLNVSPSSQSSFAAVTTLRAGTAKTGP